MTDRAVICDVYGTLLRVTAAPADAPARWDHLWRRTFGPGTGPGWAALCAALEQEVRREHEAARAAGVDCPEVCWTETMATALPELRRLTPTARDAFLDEQAQIWHQVSWMPGAVDALRALRREEGVVLGVASNAQPYTVRELARQLAVVGLSFDLFEPELCFWSFAHGFSKPNPHVFRILQARLRARGIAPGRTWMVGDRLDNDIDPARACGWRVWPLSDNGPSAFGGDWAEFLAHWRRA